MESTNKVRGYRNMLGFTQREMAEAIGMSARTYITKENKVSEFKQSEMIKFTEVVNSRLNLENKVSLEDIFF